MAFWILGSHSKSSWAEILTLEPMSKISLGGETFVVTPKTFLSGLRNSENSDLLGTQNAAIHYFKAFGLRKLSEKQDLLLQSYLNYEICDEEKLVALERFILDQTDFWVELDMAFMKDEVRWPILIIEGHRLEEISPMFFIRMPESFEMLELLRFTNFLAFRELDRFDTPAFLQRFEKMEKMAQHMDQENRIMINGLVYLRLKSQLFEIAERAMAKYPDDRSLRERLLGLLKKSPVAMSDYWRWMAGEKIFCLDTFDKMMKNQNDVQAFLGMVVGHASPEGLGILASSNLLFDAVKVILPDETMRSHIVQYFEFAKDHLQDRPLTQYLDGLGLYDRKIPKWDFFYPLIIPSLTSAIRAFATAEQMQRMLPLVEAIYNFHSREGKWPDTLIDLGLPKEFLQDTISGNSYIYQAMPQPLLKVQDYPNYNMTEKSCSFKFLPRTLQPLQ